MIEGYCSVLVINLTKEELRVRAKEWTVTRGSRSGRVAWQFVQNLAGELGVPIDQ